MHRITIDTKHGLSGRFAMKTPELIHVVRGREITELTMNNDTVRTEARPGQL